MAQDRPGLDRADPDTVMTLLIRTVLIFLMGLTCCALAGEVYTWTDDSGIRHFSNVGPSDGVETYHTLSDLKHSEQNHPDRTCRVERIYDGDSLLVSQGTLRFKIRMVGIDAPETGGGRQKGQPFSREASEFLSKRVADRSVSLTAYGMDSYNRILAEVFAGQINVNLELVSAGLAEVYPGRTPPGFDKTPYLQAQEQARRSLRGIWSLGDTYQSPRDFRKENPR
jgi:micrococcal nuclease